MALTILWKLCDDVRNHILNAFAQYLHSVCLVNRFINIHGSRGVVGFIAAA